MAHKHNAESPNAAHPSKGSHDPEVTRKTGEEGADSPFEQPDASSEAAIGAAAWIEDLRQRALVLRHKPEFTDDYALVCIIAYCENLRGRAAALPKSHELLAIAGSELIEDLALCLLTVEAVLDRNLTPVLKAGIRDATERCENAVEILRAVSDSQKIWDLLDIVFCLAEARMREIARSLGAKNRSGALTVDMQQFMARLAKKLGSTPLSDYNIVLVCKLQAIADTERARKATGSRNGVTAVNTWMKILGVCNEMGLPSRPFRSLQVGYETYAKVPGRGAKSVRDPRVRGGYWLLGVDVLQDMGIQTTPEMWEQEWRSAVTAESRSHKSKSRR
jgi:hypothetical protein